MSMTNNSRANIAASTVAYFEQQNGEDEMETSITDLVADLMHLADQHGIAFDQVYRRAADHHWHEINGTTGLG